MSDSAEQARYIETVPGQGYRFIATIRFAVVAPETHAPNGALDLVSKVVPEIRETPIERKLARPQSRWWVAAAFALAALLTIVLGIGANTVRIRSLFCMNNN